MTVNPCPRLFCRGSLLPDAWGEYRCSLCGRSPVVLMPLPFVQERPTPARKAAVAS